MFAVVNKLQTSSGGCFLCGAQNPPYLVAGITTALVGTAEGPKRVPGEVAFCIGTAEHPGCLDTALHEAGGWGPHTRRKQEQALASKLRADAEKIKRLTLELAEARGNQLTVISLDEARELGKAAS